MSTPRSGREAENWAVAIGAAAHPFVLTWLHAQDSVADRVSPSQLRALTVLDEHGPLNLNAIAAELRAIPSSASRLCHRLVAAGLLSRDVSQQNRRFVTFSLTDDGRDLLDRLEQARCAAFAAVLARMSPAARSSLLNVLRDFAAAAGDPRQRESATSTG